MTSPDKYIVFIIDGYGGNYTTYSIADYYSLDEARKRAEVELATRLRCVVAYVMLVQYSDPMLPKHILVYQAA